MENKYDILRRVFGYTAFRPGQEALIDALLSGRDVLGVMPTGGGKSVCYQVPALMLPGVTFVVSPLVSLMKDQVAALKTAGVPAAYINSSLTPEQIKKVYAYLAEGRYKIVYVAPERLATPAFLQAATGLAVPLVAVDEAHCISEWGQDFRPSYRKITDFIAAFPRRPVVGAFTATATDRVREDIVSSLKLDRPLVEVTGFDRPNLRFDVRPASARAKQIPALLREYGDRCGIIYCLTRKTVEAVAASLSEKGFSVTRYHAGLSDEERHKNQDDFLYDRRRVMVATNAFGMGIDKSNVSFVIHYNMPGSIEEYYQEAGRAGRDGSPADCVLFYSPSDVRMVKFLIEASATDAGLSGEEREKNIAAETERLSRMVGYCTASRCYRGIILDYFGQQHGERCENCGNCLCAVHEWDCTDEGRTALSCVLEVMARKHYSYGVQVYLRLLRGIAGEREREMGLCTVPSFGALATLKKEEVGELFDALLSRGYLEKRQPYGVVKPTAKAEELLTGDARLILRKREPQPKKRASAVPLSDTARLLSALKEVRLALARAEGVPAFVVFSDATLTEMAEKKPKTVGELFAVKGVGLTKIERYGKTFLDAIADFGKQSEEQ